MIERIPIKDRASWLQLRRVDLTASDIPAVAGIDPRRTHLSVWAEKTGLSPGSPDNVMMRRGRWLEPSVIAALREEHPTWTIKPAGVYLRDPDFRMGATPDAVAVDPKREGIGAIQCKVVAKPVFEEEWIDGRAPVRFEVQTLSEAMLLEASWAIVAALVIGTYTAELAEHEVPRHAAAEDRVRRTVREFWRGVHAGEQPQPNYAKDADTIEAITREMRAGAVVDLTGDNRIPELLARHQAIKAEQASLKDELAPIEAEIALKIGAAEEAIIPGWKVTRKIVHRDAFVSPASSYRRLWAKQLKSTEGPF